MGSKQTTNQNSSVDMTEMSQMLMDPRIKAAIEQGYTGIGGGLANFLANPYQVQYSDRPEGIVQNMLSRGIQNIKSQESAQNSNLARQLGTVGTGSNSALLSALQRQGGIASSGAMNALIPDALAQQREYDQARIASEMAARGQLLQGFGVGLQGLQGLAGYGQATGRNVGTKQGTEKASSTTKKGFAFF